MHLNIRLILIGFGSITPTAARDHSIVKKVKDVNKEALSTYANSINTHTHKSVVNNRKISATVKSG